jgi:hypothetical protein
MSAKCANKIGSNSHSNSQEVLLVCQMECRPNNANLLMGNNRVILICQMEWHNNSDLVVSHNNQWGANREVILICARLNNSMEAILICHPNRDHHNKELTLICHLLDPDLVNSNSNSNLKAILIICHVRAKPCHHKVYRDLLAIKTLCLLDKDLKCQDLHQVKEIIMVHRDHLKTGDLILKK